MKIKVETDITMTEVRGPVVSLTVVTAKKPGEYLIRAMYPLADPEELAALVAQYVGTLTEDIEWTTCTYDLPAYLVYGDEDRGGAITGWGWPVGIYRFPANSDVTYRGPSEVLYLPALRGPRETWQMQVRP